ncbi:hypothetical protein KQI52_04270 [bacterium]|nr:hypothetical protein [bacterium]
MKRSSAIIKFIPTLLIAVCLLYPLSTVSAQDSLYIMDEFVPAEPVDGYSLLLDVAGDNQESVWQWLQSTPTGTQFRARLLNPDTEPYPAHYARLTVDRGPIVLGLLMHRDTGERNMFDLWRASLSATYNRSRIIVGDFHVDEGLGWTVSGTPSWSSTTDAYAALRRPRSGIRMNLSAEEGWGWKGAGVSSSFDTPGTTRELARVDIWAGLQEFDSFQANADAPLYPYATQGDHSEDRTVDIVQLPARHAGGHVTLHVPFNLGEFGLTGAATEFLEDISPSVDNSRFRFADNSFSTVGIGWDVEIPDRGLEVHSEVATQSSGAMGGGFAFANRLTGETHVVASGWRATQDFATFHARPTLAFGSDPGGVTGGQLALVHTIQRTTLSGGLAADWTEPETGDLDPKQRQAVFLRVLAGSRSSLRFDGAFRLRRDIDETRQVQNVYASRLYLARQYETVFTSARYTASFERDGSGHGLSLNAQRRFAPWLAFGATLAGVKQVDAGSRVTVVETHGPGEFPFRTTSTEQVSASARVDLFPIDGMRLWVRGGIARFLEDGSSSSDRTDTLISLGLDWSDFL